MPSLNRLLPRSMRTGTSSPLLLAAAQKKAGKVPLHVLEVNPEYRQQLEDKEVLINIAYAGVNQIDYKVTRLYSLGMFTHQERTALRF